MKQLISREGIARLKARIMAKFCRKAGSGDEELDNERDQNAERQQRFRDKMGKRKCKWANGTTSRKTAKKSAW